MMAAEMPICTGFVNRLPDQRVQTAALLVLMSVALFIESPVIDLLATSTTLATSRAKFQSIRKFSVWLMVWTGAVHLLVTVTPLFHLLMTKVLNEPKAVSDAVRTPMLIMIPWSPAIGWRRHVQGILIRKGATRAIGWGTGVRLATLSTTCFIGFSSHRLAGAEVAATALTLSVVAEALFIQVVGGRTLGREQHDLAEQDGHSMKALAQFHLPLAFSTMVMLTSMPAVSSALAKSPSSLLSMNSWQVSVTLAFLLRTMAFALPEVVIANWNKGLNSGLLIRFCFGVGLCLSGLMLAMSLTGVDWSFFRTVLRADPEVARGAHIAFMACSGLPILTALTSYVRGVMTAIGVTFARLYATMLSITVLVAVLIVGVAAQWTGVLTAATALTLSQLTELGVLVGFVVTKVGRSAFFQIQEI